MAKRMLLMNSISLYMTLEPSRLNTNSVALIELKFLSNVIEFL